MVLRVRQVIALAGANIFWLAAASTLCVPVSFAQKTDPTVQQENARIQDLATLAKAAPLDITIGSGDLLHIDVFDVPQLSRDVRVTDSGDISYPLIPDPIHVAGLTPYELQQKMERVLLENGLVSHPQVSVFVKEQYSQPVNVIGAVGHPIVYQVRGPTTLLEVLAAAGGVSADAGSIVIVTRPIPNETPREKPASATTGPESDSQKITVKLQDLLETGDSAYNIPIYGGDTVTVPHAGIVYILGSGISQPGGYVLQGHGAQVTVLRAVALAHGLTNFAKPNSAYILRTDPETGHRDEIRVKLKSIEKHKAPDVPLKSNDILYVPDSTGKKALAQGGAAALGIGTAATIYHVAY